ncbi:hypothetical protein BEP19_11730 [Ammoniphilus oxalaticus]|uniref:Uncharacterized protein n=1 Tax=Ammoniphilus oxalaticus TaxID=66863 RepID=A0A419SGJ3_9BACL|nr:hypothetical protein [Ammoniphilus oxalaticus]RKD22899.1 hypothetical protein BEP19_11730 [Ammoniphilus oxalaticus]
MKRNFRPIDEIDLVAQLSDLKEVDYNNTLVISALVELLVENGIVSRKAVLQKTKELEVDMTLDLITRSASSNVD